MVSIGVMVELQLPSTGEHVSVSARRTRSPVRGRVVGEEPGGLTLELEAGGASLRRGARAELEWVHSSGVVRAAARIEAAEARPVPTVRAVLTGAPELIERREHVRAPAALEVAAWSLHEPTRLFAGTTANLGAGGALVRLPGLPPAAGVLELKIGLFPRPLVARARVLRREAPDLVVLAFETIGAEERERLAGFVIERLRELPAPLPASPSLAERLGSRFAALRRSPPE